MRKLALLLLLASPGAFAAETAWFPSSKELFRPLLADPKEPGYTLRLTSPNGSHSVTEIGIGDALGIYRSRLGGWDWQWGIGGGVVGRFNTSVASNWFEVADFTFAVPFDFRRGVHSLRLAYWHVSSHLGDDYIRLHPAASISKHFTDDTLLLYSYTPSPSLRFYAGGARAFKILPSLAKFRAQAGFEAYGPALWTRGGQPVFGVDLQALERGDWKASGNVVLGLRLPGSNRLGAVSFLLGYYHGPLYYQYRFREVETHWTFGLHLEMAAPVPEAP